VPYRFIHAKKVTPISSIGTLKGFFLPLFQAQLRLEAFPGGLLHALTERCHYVDLGANRAASLADFGGSDDFWGGVIKLYASRCGLTSVSGAEKLKSVKYLYLDSNNLGENELLRLGSLLQDGQLAALDVSNNPGCTEEVLRSLRTSGCCRHAEYFNSRRITSSTSD
jgi:hypothetical protein